MVKLELRLWVKIVGFIFIIGMISFLVREILISIKNEEIITQPAIQEASLPSITTTVYFSDTCYLLEDDDRLIIDSCFANIAKEYSQYRVRIEGNTDNTGNINDNLKLSYKRAKSVADYLVNKHGIDENRILVLGNGPARAIKDGVVGENSDYDNSRMKLIDY